MMRENELSAFGKGVTVLGIVCLALAAIANITSGNVPHPFAFAVVFAGFVLFLTAKLSVVVRRKWISFGPSLMSPGMVNLYRAGYWLMAVGLLATFTG